MLRKVCLRLVAVATVRVTFQKCSVYRNEYEVMELGRVFGTGFCDGQNVRATTGFLFFQQFFDEFLGVSCFFIFVAAACATTTADGHRKECMSYCWAM